MRSFTLKTTHFASLLFMAILISSMFTYLMVSAASEITITENSFQSNYAYLIFKDGSTYYAQNGQTKEIAWSSTTASTVINNVLAAVGDTSSVSIVKIVGDITVTTMLQLSASNVTIEVSGTLEKTTGSDWAILYVHNCSNINLIGGTFTNSTGSVDQTLLYVGVDDSTIDGVTVTYGISIRDCDNVDVLNCDVSGSAIGLTYGTDNCNILNNYIHNTVGHGITTGGAGYSSTNNKLNHNTIEHVTGLGIGITDGSYNTEANFNIIYDVSEDCINVEALLGTCWQNQIIGNNIRDSGQLALAGTASYLVKGCIVSDNVISNSAGNGIYLIYAEDNVVSGNYVYSPLWNGLSLVNATGNTINNLQIIGSPISYYGVVDSGTSDWNMYSGINTRVISGSVGIKVVGTYTKIADSYNITTWISSYP